ncbi:MAG TPA: ribosome biogenesis/translation initiation ATPase RLI [Candidatus Nanoarchaeia archaeon]|nr:ribosome biogenesis/translation initiation ATPase RLI [Candidatus Nanoarchaeia archaeon]
MTRIAIIEREKCQPARCGNYLCAKVCPVNRMGKECITANPTDTKARIDEKLCTGCGICPKRCPFEAITVINLPEVLKREPIHRFGENQFELFGLPFPMFHKVVGLVGRNGIGKSTALKILASLLKPNLGNWKKEASFEEVKKYFAGTEMFNFLERLEKREIKVSYKPQQVDVIPRQFKGKVKELLQHANESGRLDEIASCLLITDVLNSNINEISGGELQRVAIAAASLKKANLYIFDEPTSYLDIKQRMLVSEFIGTLAADGEAVIVVEHDLIVLDHMSELVHIMYGQEGVYGVVSGIKSVREGINSFLDGFLKEENMRFRNYSIKFEKSQIVEKKEKMPVCSWSNVRKILGQFHLQAEGGTIYQNDIIGILGENGTGKTTFMSLAAGLIKSDEGNLVTKKIAYKPQYLKTESDELVAVFLKEAIQKHHAQLIVPLGIERLFSRKLSELSGGELQRVAIANCLSQEAELFLLDEPSAYLDVEQRLAVSKAIKHLTVERDISVLVVDHDLMFMDYLAEKIIVFSGQPGHFGKVEGPFPLQEGMNHFLKQLDITFRRDKDTLRPRINKKDSVLDREQKEEGKYYYI